MDGENLGQGNNTEGVGAAATGEPAGTRGDGADPEGQAAAEPERKYTDADVDRIVAKKIAAERQKMQKLLNEGQQESELEIRERNVLKRELMADAKDALLNEGLPISLASVMNYGSKEDYEKSFKELTDVFREALTAECKRHFGMPAPKVSTGNGEDKAIADAFAPKARY